MAEIDENPEEAQAAEVDKQINTILGGQANVGQGYNPLVPAYSLGFGNEFLNSIGGIAPNLARSGNTNSLNNEAFEEIMDVGTTNELNRLYNLSRQNKLSVLNQQKLDLLRKARDRRLGRVKEKEGKLQGTVESIGTEIHSAIDQQLTTLLEELGYKANVSRQQTGQAFADRGLIRSGFANKAISDVTLEEQRQKGEQRLIADQQKDTVTKGIDDVKTGIQQRRERLEQSNSLTEIAAAENVAFNFDQDAIQSSLLTRLNEMEIDASSRSFLYKAIGSTIGNIAKLLAGG